jgi:galactokinase
MNQQINENFGLTNEKTYSASAHGRLDIMGGIADYSGSLVLQMPIAEKTTVSIRKTENNLLKIKSLTENKTLEFSISIDQIKSILTGDYKSAKQLFNHEKWASYVVGCIILLIWEKKIDLTGFEILIESDIPIGKGVSSSAALEVATLKVFSEYYQLHFEGTELPTLAQKVENLIVGAPCGLMDQLTSHFGKPNHLLPILCQPDILHESLPFPKDVYVMGIDSGVRHSVSGNDYGKVRTATFMGYSIMANLEGFDTKNIKEFKRDELPFSGYLCNVKVPYYNAKFSKMLPKTMSGKDFIKEYGDIYDHVTAVNPEEKYPVLNATRHAVFENSRVEKFQKAFLSIEKTLSKKIPYKLMGSFMDESNMSYSACGLGSEKTDELVQMAYLARNRGVYGAKITGGGSGGTVAILCIGEKGKQAVRDIWTQYQEKNRIEVKLFG